MRIIRRVYDCVNPFENNLSTKHPGASAFAVWYGSGTGCRCFVSVQDWHIPTAAVIRLPTGLVVLKKNSKHQTRASRRLRDNRVVICEILSFPVEKQSAESHFDSSIAQYVVRVLLFRQTPQFAH